MNKKITLALVFIFALSFVGAMLPLFTGGAAANANSAQTSWLGTTQQGVVYAGSDTCPLMVTSEQLTFNIPTDLPTVFEERADFDAYVEATYEFLNPTDDDITATLAFPFGNKPHHLKDVTFADTTRRITIGGREADNALRCTFKSPYEPFDLENDIANLRDEYIFYNTFPAADTSVYAQTYRVNAPDGAADTHLKLNIQAKDKVIFAVSDRKNVTFKLADDLFEITLNSASCDIVMYSFDKDIDFRRSLWAFDSDRKYVSGSSFAAVDEQHEITFAAALQEMQPEAKAYTTVDWYNVAAEYFRNSDIFRGARTFVADSLHVAEEYVLQWFVYELSVPRGATVTNTVRAPLFVGINIGYNRPVYNVEYLLSPASCWAEFGTLDITVNTDLYMLDSGSLGFAKADGCYKAHFDGLPKGELNFRVCADQNPQRKSGPYRMFFMILLGGFIVFLLIIGVIIAAVVLIITNYEKRKKQSN